MTEYDKWKSTLQSQYKQSTYPCTVNKLLRYLRVNGIKPTNAKLKDLNNFMITNTYKLNTKNASSAIRDFYKYLYSIGAMNHNPTLSMKNLVRTSRSNTNPFIRNRRIRNNPTNNTTGNTAMQTNVEDTNTLNTNIQNTTNTDIIEIDIKGILEVFNTLVDVLKRIEDKVDLNANMSKLGFLDLEHHISLLSKKLDKVQDHNSIPDTSPININSIYEKCVENITNIQEKVWATEFLAIFSKVHDPRTVTKIEVSDFLVEYGKVVSFTDMNLALKTLDRLFKLASNNIVLDGLSAYVAKA